MERLKTNSTIEIPILHDLGTGRWHFNYNHSTFMNDDGETMHSADTLLFDHKPTQEEIEGVIGRDLTDEELIRLKG